MNKEIEQLRQLIAGMRAAFARGENAMAYAREHAPESSAGSGNSLAATLIAYDLQAGLYCAGALANPEAQNRWCNQIAALVRPHLPASGTVLEVGVGEATTLAGVLQELRGLVGRAYGFDVSWSRVTEGQRWLTRHDTTAELFVGDLFHIPLANDSIDVVYSSHSLEPNGGREEAAIAECLRVARHAVVLVEPIYELASSEAQARMRQHGYVRELRETGVRLGAAVTDYRLLEYCHNLLNPSGVILLQKPRGAHAAAQRNAVPHHEISEPWSCPMTGAPLRRQSDCFVAQEVGIVYPALRGVPLLRSEHAIVASKLVVEDPG